MTNLYEGFLQRGPDAGGLGFWSGQATVGTGRQNVLNAFATSGGFYGLAGTLYREAFWLVSDQLGTPRMIVGKSGSLASVKRHDYLPFGEEIGGPQVALLGGRTTTQGYASDATRHRFTGYEADLETGLNFAEARYQSNLQGRFTSVDPLGASASVGDPQSFNRYSYVSNNPTNLTDPRGLVPYGADRSWSDVAGNFWGGGFNMNDRNSTLNPSGGEIISKRFEADVRVVVRKVWRWSQYSGPADDPNYTEHSNGAWVEEPVWQTHGVDFGSEGFGRTARFPGFPGDEEGDSIIEQYVRRPVRTALQVANWASDGARNVGYALMPDYAYVNGGVPLLGNASLSFSKDRHLYFSFAGPGSGAKNLKFGGGGGVAYFVTTKMTPEERDSTIRGPGLNVQAPFTPVGAYFSGSGGPPAVTLSGPLSGGLNVSGTRRIF